MATKIIEAKNAAEFEQAKKDATGQVILEFVDLQNCGACQEEAPKVEAFANKCGADVTLIKVPMDLNGGNAEGDKLADTFKVEGLPTLFVAASGAELTPEKAKEIADSSKLKSVIKCSRK